MALAGQIRFSDSEILHYTNATGAVIPHQSIVVAGNRIGITRNTLADGATGVVAITGTWPMPVNSALTSAAGDVLGWDVADEEWNDDLVNNTIHGIVEPNPDGTLCSTPGYQIIFIG